MYSFGAMLSFTVAHAAVVALRYKGRDEELIFRARPNLRWRGVDWPLFAIFGGLGTGSPGSSWSSRNRSRAGWASAGSRRGSSATPSTAAGWASR